MPKKKKPVKKPKKNYLAGSGLGRVKPKKGKKKPT